MEDLYTKVKTHSFKVNTGKFMSTIDELKSKHGNDVPDTRVLLTFRKDNSIKIGEVETDSVVLESNQTEESSDFLMELGDFDKMRYCESRDDTKPMTLEFTNNRKLVVHKFYANHKLGAKYGYDHYKYKDLNGVIR